MTQLSHNPPDIRTVRWDATTALNSGEADWKHFPEQQGDTLTLAIKAAKGIDDPAARLRIEKVIAELDAAPITGPVISPYQDENLVTEDRRIARTTIPLTT